jgi:hypothetical protein
MTKTANKNKATHSGSCQACGSFQKLPGDVLSKHGYTTRWGFFEGVCGGSGYQAFEEGCDLIERFIAQVNAKLARAREFQAELRARPAEGTTEAWIKVYQGSNRPKGSPSYLWTLCEIEFEERSSDYSGTYFLTWAINPKDGKRERADTYSMMSADKLDYILHFNSKRAAEMQAEIEKMEEYIAWQTKRVAEWKPGALTPVGA